MRWHHITKRDDIYLMSVASRELWQQAIGVVNPQGNPTVSEFSRRHARIIAFQGIKDFQFI